MQAMSRSRTRYWRGRYSAGWLFEWVLLEESLCGPTWRPAAGLGDRPLNTGDYTAPAISRCRDREAATQETISSQHHEDNFSCICSPISAMTITGEKNNKPELHPELETSLGWGADVTSAESEKNSGDWPRTRNKAEAPAPTSLPSRQPLWSVPARCDVH